MYQNDGDFLNCNIGHIEIAIAKKRLNQFKNGVSFELNADYYFKYAFESKMHLINC